MISTGGLNTCNIIGHVEDYDDTKYNPRDGSGAILLIVKVSITRWDNRTSNEKTFEDDFRIACYGDIAGYVYEEVDTGMAIRVEGPQRTRMWTKRDCGCRHYTKEILARYLARLPADRT